MKLPVDYSSAAELLTNVFDNIDSAQMKKTNSVVNAWKNIVSKIKPDGEKLAAHSRIIDLKNNILLVETDHPGWTQLLQMRRSYILKGLKLQFPDLEISTIGFKLKGDNFETTDSQKKPSFESMDKVITERVKDSDKYTKKYIKNDNVNKKQEINPELQKCLDKLRNSILTNH
ncbi:MAG: hypothetical protein BKP49_06235 [Treponema sp. CETP13]|nr:MAG: hypothetical protein BKP49_06235 [Treponema sp. CETP13]